MEWLFCVIFPNLKVLQGINQQYWFVTGTLELLYSGSGRITSLDQSLVDRNTAQCTFTHSAIDIENHQTRMGGKTHSIKFFSHGPPIKVSIHHQFVRAKIQIWKMGILPIKITEDKHNHIKSYGTSISEPPPLYVFCWLKHKYLGIKAGGIYCEEMFNKVDWELRQLLLGTISKARPWNDLRKVYMEVYSKYTEVGHTLVVNMKYFGGEYEILWWWIWNTSVMNMNARDKSWKSQWPVENSAS